MMIQVDGMLYIRSPTAVQEAEEQPAPPIQPAPQPTAPMALAQTRLEVIDEILSTPRRPAPRVTRGQGGVQMQGLPRCISNSRYWTIL